MKIIGLKAQNFMKLLAVDITPEGNIVEVTGPNGAGKSSVLNAIYAALAGEGVIKSQPVHTGAKEGYIDLDLGELKIRRTFTVRDDGETTTSLKVTAADGSKPAKAQTLLNSLMSGLTFDPLEFARKQPSAQYEALKPLVKGFDFAANTKARKEAYDKRTDANRRAEIYKQQAAGVVVPVVDPNAPSEEELAKQIDEIGAYNAGIEKRRANRAVVQREIDAHVDAVTALGRDILDASNEITALKGRIAALETTIVEKTAAMEVETTQAETKHARLDAAPPLPEPRSVATLTEQLTKAREGASAGEAAKRKQTLIDDSAKAAAESAALTTEISNLDDAKTQAIAGAALPVQGLGFGDDMITLNGLPFDQASSAEQLLASVGIAAAMNPKLRVIRIADGSLLDRKSWAMLAEFAEKADMQIWAEVVESDRAGAILIEDGMVAGAAIEPAKAELAKPAPAKRPPAPPADPYEVFKAAMRDAENEAVIDYSVEVLKQSKWWVLSTPKEKAYVAALADQARARVGVSTGADDL